MIDRPILFRDDMVRAMLAGTKTVTRRIGPTWAAVQPGQRLWVRECFALPAWGDHLSPAEVGKTGLWYRATQPTTPTAVDLAQRGRWRPSIHMPRWGCRLLLEVVALTELPSPMGQSGWLMPELDDEEAGREGFASRSDFLVAWASMHPGHRGPVYRVEFQVTP